MITVTELRKTCDACPSQWEGKTSDNRQIYIRYRWGNLAVSVSEPNDTEIWAAVEGKYVYQKQVGDGLDGVMELDELKMYTAGVLEFL